MPRAPGRPCADVPGRSSGCGPTGKVRASCGRRPRRWPMVAPMTPDQIALQLYTVRRPLARDLAGTLRRVADAGYGSVEIAGVPERDRDALPALLADAGLEAIASHEGLDRLRTGVGPVADWLEALDCPRVIVPSLPDAEQRTVDGLRRLIDELNGYAADLGERGIRLGYHNHAAEFGPLEGTTAWDVLLADLAPEIEMELDVYWASVGGRDPVAEIRRAADRVRLLHMKDRRAGAPPHDAPAGAGTLDLAAIVQAGDAAGVVWYIAEQDEPGDEIADITASLRHLRTLAAGPERSGRPS